MEAVQTININVPVADLSFFEKFIKKMGWSVSVSAHPAQKDTSDKVSMDEALRVMDSLAVRGDKPVPADERGIDALIEAKYAQK